MATATPVTTERVVNAEELDDVRLRLELAYVFATLHGGGPVETEKTKNVSDFIAKMMPVIKNGEWITS